MFRKRASAVVQQTVKDGKDKLTSNHSNDEALTQIIRALQQAAAPFSDSDGSIEASMRMQRAKAPKDAKLPAILTCRGFSASLSCPKRFYLQQNRRDLVPEVSIGDAIRIEDNVSFSELARRWDRLQFGSRAVLVSERNFDEAVQRTEAALVEYFETLHAQLGEQAPSLTIHRPAFAAPFGGANADTKTRSAEENPLLLCARPAVLRFRPKDNQWVIIEASAVVDPFSNAARQAQCLQRLHFTSLAFRYWVSQAHIPIQIRKRFLNIDFDTVTQENLKGHRLESTAEVAVPLDLKRSGLLHIRQFFPGPVTLMDCDPSRLVKYVQRLSLEDMLDADMNSNHRYSSSAFDLTSTELQIQELRKEVEELQKVRQGHRHLGSSTSSRAAKKMDTELQKLFAAQQRLMESIIIKHTLRLVEKSHDAENVAKWTQFSIDSEETIKPTYTDDADGNEGRKIISKKTEAAGKKTTKKGGGGKKEIDPLAEVGTIPTPCVVPYSSFLGAHCSRGDMCPFFAEGLCLPKKLDDPIEKKDNHLFAIPSTAVSRKAMWWNSGLRTVRDVLHDYKAGKLKLTAPQLRYVKAASAGQLCINPKEIELFFSRIRYPAFFIDFEATQFALPPFDKIVAYQPTPFQFSLDVFQEDILTETPTHYDFLHFGKGYSPNADPRRGCVEELMRIVHTEREKKRQAMEDSGELQRIAQEREAQEAAAAAAATGTKRRGRKPSKQTKSVHITRANPLQEPVHPYDGCFIAHFASFEKSCLEKMGQLVDVYKEEIKAFYFLDTLDLFKRGIVHPNAHGSNSLKKVLPALCPDFQYGVFGDETTGDDDGGGDANRQDEQKGENAMGVFRLWYNQEGGGTLRDLQHIATRDRMQQHHPHQKSKQGKESTPLVIAPVRQDVREKAWATLRIQLLEYCSLDTKALFEIMRQVWQEKEAVKGQKTDKGGWVMTTPLPREFSL